jgi:hypothetical protein
MPAPAQEYLANVREFTMAEGLSNDQILSLLQDSEGFIWIGTKYGLNRFDGHAFTSFTKESHGLQSNIINELLEGPDGNLWMVRSQESYGKFEYYSIDLLDVTRTSVRPWEAIFPDPPFSLEQVERLWGVPGGILFLVKEQGYYLLERDRSFQPLRWPVRFRIYEVTGTRAFFRQIERTLRYDGPRRAGDPNIPLTGQPDHWRYGAGLPG